MFDKNKIIAQETHADGTTTYLINSSSMSYFSKSGKARLAIKTRYHVYANMTEGVPTNGKLSQFGFTSKAKAVAYFKRLVTLSKIHGSLERVAELMGA